METARSGVLMLVMFLRIWRLWRFSTRKKKGRFLPPAQTDDGVGVTVSGKRPGGVFLPRDVSHGPAVLDFTVCSGIAAHVYRLTFYNPQHVFGSQKTINWDPLNTDAVCRRQGFMFIPTVLFEARSGAVSRTAR
eukprot:5996608-Amphidinium_carterae.1